MAPQVTEIAYVTLKPGIELEGTSPSAQTWAETIATLQRQDGYQRAHYGRTIESPNLLILMIDWDSVEAHKKFMKVPEYTPYVQRLYTIMEGVHLHHFLPTPSPPSVFGIAPVIEFTTFYEAYPDFKESAGKFIHACGSPEGFVGFAYGETVEEVGRHAGGEEGKKAKAVVLTIGWKSVDAHMKFRETETFKNNIGLMRGNHGGVEMFHVPFKAV